MGPKHIVLAIIKNKRHEFLIAKRHVYSNVSDLWGVPGGKVEKGETALEAIQRDVKEEIGVQVIRAEHLMQFTHHYSDKPFLFDVFHLIEYEGEVVGAEGQEIRWVPLNDLDQYTFPEANIKLQPLLQRLS